MGLHDTVYDDWIREAEKRAEDRGEARGEARVLEKMRGVCLNFISLRLGALPAELVQFIADSNMDRCGRLMEQVARIESVSELDWRE